MLAIRLTNPRSSGGTYNDAYPIRIVLHVIEGSANPSMIEGHAYPPHWWYNPSTRTRYETVPLDRSAFALERPAWSGVETNKARAFQVEIEGRSAETPDWPIEWLDAIAEDIIVPLCQEADRMGSPIDLAAVPAPGVIGGSASIYGPQRMTEADWRAFRGICGHRHVPNNEHWDPGALDVKRIAQHAAIIIGGMLVDAGLIQPEGGEQYMLQHFVRVTEGELKGTIFARYTTGALVPIAPEEFNTEGGKINVVDTTSAGLRMALAD